MVTLYRKFPGALTFEKLFKDPFFNDPGSLRNRMRQDMGGMGIYLLLLFIPFSMTPVACGRTWEAWVYTFYYCLYPFQ